MTGCYRFSTVFILVCSLATVAQAQWASDPAVGNPVCTAPKNQILPQIVSDGKGGAIVMWMDERLLNSEYVLYAQRIDRSGKMLWQQNGVALTPTNGSHLSPHIVADGSSGAFVCWHDARNGNNDVFAQHVDSSGNLLWQSDGVPVILGTHNQSDPVLCSDDSGGVYIVWSDNTDQTMRSDDHLWGQRLYPDGTPAWDPLGIRICAAQKHQNLPEIIPDGVGGAIISWHDYRSTNYDIYAQRVNRRGSILWALNGVKLCAAGGDQTETKLASDGKSGAFVSWLDLRNGDTQQGVFVQRVAADGTVPWGGDGVRVANNLKKEAGGYMIPDGKGGVIICFNEVRNGTDPDIFAQSIDSTGALGWTDQGADVCVLASIQYPPRIDSDGAGGALITWEDRRPGSTSDAYAQRVGPNGAPLWTLNGVGVGTAANSQPNPVALGDGTGAGIFAYEDYRADFSNGGVFAFKVLPDGSYPLQPPNLQLDKKSLAFGTVRATTTKDLTVKISNTGGQTLQVGAVTSSNPTFTTTFQSGAIAPNQSSDMVIRFAPTVPGAQNGYFLVPSNAATSPDTVVVSGMGSGNPIVTLSDQSIDFGEVLTGVKKNMTFSVSNTGDDTLHITSMSTSNSMYRVNTTVGTVFPGKSMNDTVSFTPTVLGSIPALLIIHTNATKSSDTIRLTGTGKGAGTLQATPSEITFGSVRLGSYRDTLLVLSNSGTDTIRISDIASDLGSVAARPTSMTIPPGKSVSDTVRFTPSALGAVSGLLVVTSNTTKGKDTVLVRGTGSGEAQISTVTSIDFGQVPFMIPHDTAIAIRNTGTDTLHVTDISSDNQVFSARPGIFAVPPGGAFMDTVRCQSNTIGPSTGTLSVTSNAAGSPSTISVSANFIETAVRFVTHPSTFDILSMSPNPSSDAIHVTFGTAGAIDVRVEIFSSSGMLVQRMPVERFAFGSHTITVSTTALGPGVYFCVLRASGIAVARPFAVLR